mmetsp:Transcript_13591/g.21239  ORF Transcript_13591/g.21239 Transcript_13591/m.21239 type:complete len:146 (-) Transcript_13591:11-448(-)
MKQFKLINDMPVEQRKGQPLMLNDIIESLNGFGRIVQYRVFDDNFIAENCTIEYVQEGRFRQGSMDGYCRMFDAREDGFAQVGYFREGVPMGKYQRFTLDGVCEEEGIREGADLVKQIEVRNYLTRTLNSGKQAEWHQGRVSLKA